MYRSGRPVDMNFDDNENLYNRFRKEYLAEGKFLPTGIKFPDWSVNREKYSEPEDVLIPDFHEWGIAQFKVGDVPDTLPSPGDIKFDFKVEHDPVEDNYSHSEVRSYKNGQHTRKIEVNRTVKKTFRQILSEKIVIVKEPNI
jgi:hypothetical protein